jgi:carboxypeptidase PM20D1
MVILKPPMFPGLEKDLAIIGVAEKGFLTLELRYMLILTYFYHVLILKKSVNGTGGHASLPPQHTSIGTLSAAISRLENNPHPPSLLGAGPMLDFVGRELSYPMKAVMANIWMFKWPLFSIFSRKPTLNSLIR